MARVRRTSRKVATELPVAPVALGGAYGFKVRVKSLFWGTVTRGKDNKYRIGLEDQSGEKVLLEMQPSQALRLAKHILESTVK